MSAFSSNVLYTVGLGIFDDETELIHPSVTNYGHPNMTSASALESIL